MGRRRTPEQRDIKRKRNAIKRSRKTKEIKPKAVMLSQLDDKRRRKRLEPIAHEQAIILDELCKNEGGGFVFCNLKLKKPTEIDKFQDSLRELTMKFGEDAAEEAVDAAIQGFKQKWVDQGKLVDSPVQIGVAPKAKRHHTGYIEVLSASDPLVKEAERQMKTAGIIDANGRLVKR
jgi:hypothetical protein